MSPLDDLMILITFLLHTLFFSLSLPLSLSLFYMHFLSLHSHSVFYIQV